MNQQNNNYDGYSDMQSTYSTDCEHINFVIRVSHQLLREKEQDPTGLGSLQRLEELSKFTFREYIVDPGNIHQLDFKQSFIKLRYYEQSIKNFIDVFDQSQYKGVLSGLAE